MTLSRLLSKPKSEPDFDSAPEASQDRVLPGRKRLYGLFLVSLSGCNPKGPLGALRWGSRSSNGWLQLRHATCWGERRHMTAKRGTPRKANAELGRVRCTPNDAI